MKLQISSEPAEGGRSGQYSQKNPHSVVAGIFIVYLVREEFVDSQGTERDG